jgi:hypothetical protein
MQALESIVWTIIGRFNAIRSIVIPNLALKLFSKADDVSLLGLEGQAEGL